MSLLIFFLFFFNCSSSSLYFSIYSFNLSSSCFFLRSSISYYFLSLSISALFIFSSSYYYCFLILSSSSAFILAMSSYSSLSRSLCCLSRASLSNLLISSLWSSFCCLSRWSFFSYNLSSLSFCFNASAASLAFSNSISLYRSSSAALNRASSSWASLRWRSSSDSFGFFFFLIGLEEIDALGDINDCGDNTPTDCFLSIVLASISPNSTGFFGLPFRYFLFSARKSVFFFLGTTLKFLLESAFITSLASAADNPFRLFFGRSEGAELEGFKPLFRFGLTLGVLD